VFPRHCGVGVVIFGGVVWMVVGFVAGLTVVLDGVVVVFGGFGLLVVVTLG